MKTLHILIIATSAMISLVAFGTYVVIHPIFGGIAPSSTIKGYIQINTPGLEKTYKVGQPINFSVLIQGFGLYPCQPPQIAIYNNAQTTPVFYYTTQSVSCPGSSKHYFFYFPSQNNTFSTMINKTGNYTAKVLIGQDSYQKQFSVTAYDITGIYAGVTDNSTISSHNQTSGCGSPPFFNTLPALTPKEQQSAISLAEGSKAFQENTIGMNYTVFTVAPNYSFDSKTCSNVSINAVTVGFKLGNGSSLGIYEDGNISKVTGINIPHISHNSQESSKSQP
jgi:hypothetical protein